MTILTKIFLSFLFIFAVFNNASHSAPTESTSRNYAAAYEGLSCSICLELYREPRVLPCGHTNCTHCLQAMQRNDNNGKIHCPQCRAECPLTVSELPMNYTIKELVAVKEQEQNDLRMQQMDFANPNELQLASMIDKYGWEDEWRLEEGVLYRWKDWRLIRTKDSLSNHSLFIWCGAITLELVDQSIGWLRFFMNDRLGNLYTNGDTDYDDDNVHYRARFIEKFQKAKEAVPSNTQQMKSILSIPRASQAIEFGDWILSSEKAGTMVVTNLWKGTQGTQKLTIKEDFVDLLQHLRDQN